MSTIRLVDSVGKDQEPLKLGITLEGPVNPQAYACAIRVLLQNWRQGTVSCKARSDVAFSTKKPWRQKGTGRARAGSARSPIWRKGGVTFGPSPRVRTLKMNRKQRRMCLKHLLQGMLEKSAVCCIDCDLGQEPSTKKAHNILKSLGLAKKKVVLFLPYDDTVNFASFRNIPSVGILSFDQPNAFDMSGTECWMFLKKDFNLFKDMVSKWM